MTEAKIDTRPDVERGATAPGPRLRLAVVVEAFPVEPNSVSGLPMFHTVKDLQRLADVTVYYCRPAYPTWRSGLRRRSPQYLSVHGIPVHNVFFPAFRFLSRPFNGKASGRRLKRLLEQRRPDAILAFFIYPQGYAAVDVGVELNLPVLIVAMGSDIKQIKDPFTKILTGEALRRADCLLAVSEDLRQRAIAMGARAERAHTVGNGYDPSVFRPSDRTRAREELGVPRNTELVLFVGRLVSLKGLDDLIRAARLLTRTHPQVQVICIGDGPRKTHLLRMVHQEQLGSVVHFVGPMPQSKIARWLAACDVFCLPSHSEGAPNVITEALACGRPVVSTDVGGIPDLVDSTRGILVKPGDAATLAQAMDQALARTWDEKAIAAGQTRTWNEMVCEIHDHVSRVLSSRGAAVNA